MPNWMVKQETEYLDFIDDAYSYPGQVTFFSPMDPEKGFFVDRELDPEETAEILMRIDEISQIEDRVDRLIKLDELFEIMKGE